MDLPYHLPKPGFKTKNNVDNIYIYNDQMYRKKGNETWLERNTFLNTNPSDDDIVEIATASLDKSRWSRPIEVRWGETYSGGEGNNGGKTHTVFATLLLVLALL